MCWTLSGLMLRQDVECNLVQASEALHGTSRYQKPNQTSNTNDARLLVFYANRILFSKHKKQFKKNLERPAEMLYSSFL